MRKAKQAAASLALNEVGFKQFKTKQSRVEVGEGSCKAKVVEQIIARAQGETENSRGGKVGGPAHRGHHQGREQGRSISRRRIEGFNSVTEHQSGGPVAMIAGVEERVRSKSGLEQQSSARKSLRHNSNPGATSWNDKMPKGSSTMNASNQNLSPFGVGTGDTDDSGSFEDTDGSSDKEVGESSLAAFVNQQKAKLCKSRGIDGTKESFEELHWEDLRTGRRDLAENLVNITLAENLVDVTLGKEGGGASCKTNEGVKLKEKKGADDEVSALTKGVQEDGPAVEVNGECVLKPDQVVTEELHLADHEV